MIPPPTPEDLARDAGQEEINRIVAEIRRVQAENGKLQAEVELMRAQAHKWGTGLCSAHTPPDPECRICNVWLVFDELVDENVAAALAAKEAVK